MATRGLMIAIVLAAAPAHADTGGELAFGANIGAFRFHGEMMMTAGPELAAGIHAGRFALLVDGEHQTLIPDSVADSASANRIGWRARYELPYCEDRMGRQSDARFRMSVWLEAGTGEQFVSWDHVDTHRADLAVGFGWLMSVHDRATLRMRWGLYLALRMTSAAALESDATARTDAPTAPASGADRSYVFSFGYRF